VLVERVNRPATSESSVTVEYAPAVPTADSRPRERWGDRVSDRSPLAAWRAARLLAVCAVALLLTACTGNGGSEASPSQPATATPPQSSSPPALPSGPTFDMRAYGATCDGTHDDSAALRAAAGAARQAGGGIIAVPAGTCRIVATGSAAASPLPAGTMLAGAGADSSTLLLDTNDPRSYRAMLHTDGDDVAIQDVTIRSVDAITAVLVQVGTGQDVTLQRVVLQGPADPGSSTVHGLLLPGSGTLTGLGLFDVTMRQLDYGLFQQNASTARVTGITVENSTFDRTRAENLSFNAPNGTMRDVTVQDSTFTGGNSFAVSLANVQNATVANNTLSGFAAEFVHVEDESADIRITGNEFSGNVTVPQDWYSFVFVISGSRDVQITDNTFRTSPAEHPFQCVYVGPGGDAPAPEAVVVSDNSAELAENTRLISVNGGADVSVEK
jgi:hypothetical protein